MGYLLIGTPIVVSILLIIFAFTSKNKIFPPYLLAASGTVGLIAFCLFFTKMQDDPWGLSFIALPFITLLIAGLAFGFIWSGHILFKSIKREINPLWVIPAVIVLIYSGIFVAEKAHSSYMTDKYKSGNYSRDEFREFLKDYNAIGQTRQTGFWMFEVIEKVINDADTPPETLEDILDGLPGGGYPSRVAYHPNVTPEIIDKIITNKITDAYYGLARNQDIPYKAFQLLSETEDKNIIENLAGNKSTPHEIIKNIYYNGRIPIRERSLVAFHENSDDTIMKDDIVNYFLNENDSSEIRKYVSHVSASKSVSLDNRLLMLTNDKLDFYSKTRLIFNEQMPDNLIIEYVETMLQTEDNLQNLYNLKNSARMRGLKKLQDMVGSRIEALTINAPSKSS